MSKSQSKFNPTSRKAITLIVAAALVGVAVTYTYPKAMSLRDAYHQQQINDARKDRIVAIYDSLDLSKHDYQITGKNVFGDKRPYEWDSSRSYSSSVNYIRRANVDTTAAELRTAIEKAGFTYFDEPYPGSAFKEYHFKSAQGEYVRLNVSSKPRDDAFRTNEDAAKNIDPNMGPSSVTIKVNLDDNNE
jgi:hypothetical protein